MEVPNSPDGNGINYPKLANPEGNRAEIDGSIERAAAETSHRPNHVRTLQSSKSGPDHSLSALRRNYGHVFRTVLVGQASCLSRLSELIG